MSGSNLLRPHKRIGVGIIHNGEGKILIDRRLKKGEMGGLWEFPGGKVEPGETILECIKRELKEELDIEVTVEELLLTIKHDYPKFQVTLYVHRCQYISGIPKAIESEEIRWVTLTELNQYTFPEANYQIIDLLQKSA